MDFFPFLLNSKDASRRLTGVPSNEGGAHRGLLWERDSAAWTRRLDQVRKHLPNAGALPPGTGIRCRQFGPI